MISNMCLKFFGQIARPLTSNTTKVKTTPVQTRGINIFIWKEGPEPLFLQNLLTNLLISTAFSHSSTSFRKQMAEIDTCMSGELPSIWTARIIMFSATCWGD